MDNEHYQDHLLAYIDCLGFSERISHSSQGSDFINVLTTLRSFSNFQTEFNIDTKKHEHGQTTNFCPSISAFSDHIVISYPISDMITGHNISIEAILFAL